MIKRTTLRLWFSGLIVIGILAFIWGNSMMSADFSRELSSFVGKILQLQLLPNLDLQSDMQMLMLRKLAHYTEFTILGIGLGWHYGMIAKKRRWALLLPLMCGSGVAIIDECIQFFSPNRAPAVLDVCIDTGGVITGIAVIYLLHWVATGIRNRISAVRR